jgi:hypothetical protein
MKAILDYNGFTKMVELPQFMPEFYVPVTEELSVAMMITQSSPERSGIKRWKFEFRKWLVEREIALYHFNKEE